MSIKELPEKKQKKILNLIEACCISIQYDMDNDIKFYNRYIVNRGGEVTDIAEPYLYMNNSGIEKTYLEIDENSPEYFGLKSEGDRDIEWDKWALDNIQLND